jgi:hypothetical protein
VAEVVLEQVTSHPQALVARAALILVTAAVTVVLAEALLVARVSHTQQAALAALAAMLVMAALAHLVALEAVLLVLLVVEAVEVVALLALTVCQTKVILVVAVAVVLAFWVKAQVALEEQQVLVQQVVTYLQFLAKAVLEAGMAQAQAFQPLAARMVAAVPLQLVAVLVLCE